MESMLTMRRDHNRQRARQSDDVDVLVKLAMQLSESDREPEVRTLERRLAALINEHLARRSDRAIDAALDELDRIQHSAYDNLVDVAEACAESQSIEIDGVGYEALLVLVPLLAYSPYRLPATRLASSVRENLRVQLHGHIASRDARIAVADTLFSIEQLPEEFSDVRRSLDALTEALGEGVLRIDQRKLRVPPDVSTDTRYVMAVIAAPAGSGLFHWQEPGVNPGTMEADITAFKKQAEKVLQPTMPGCHFSVLAPQAFHTALREADCGLRNFSLVALIAHLRLAYGLTPVDLSASVGIFDDDRGDLENFPEVRIGLAHTANEDAVIAGVCWPLLGDREDHAFEDIETALRDLRIGSITMHSHRFPLEFCDDCGAVMYPTSDGQVVHPEPPADLDERPAAPLH